MFAKLLEVCLCMSADAQPGTDGSFDVVVELRTRAIRRTRARQFLDQIVLQLILINIDFLFG